MKNIITWQSFNTSISFQTSKLSQLSRQTKNWSIFSTVNFWNKFSFFPPKKCWIFAKEDGKRHTFVDIKIQAHPKILYPISEFVLNKKFQKGIFFLLLGKRKRMLQTLKRFDETFQLSTNQEIGRSVYR